jgi:hypothetical protein
VVEEILYPALEDFQIDIMIGEGPAARSVKLDLPPFTLVGATTRAGMLTNPLRDRFGIVARLEFYTAEELRFIVSRSARCSMSPIDPAARWKSPAARAARRASPTACCAGCATTPRSRPTARSPAPCRCGAGCSTSTTAGLDLMDRKLLSAVIDKFGGGPVGVDNLAAAIGEARDTIEDVLEPYLIQQGYLQRTRAAASRRRRFIATSVCDQRHVLVLLDEQVPLEFGQIIDVEDVIVTLVGELIGAGTLPQNLIDLQAKPRPLMQVRLLPGLVTEKYDPALMINEINGALKTLLIFPDQAVNGIYGEANAGSADVLAGKVKNPVVDENGQRIPIGEIAIDIDFIIFLYVANAEVPGIPGFRRVDFLENAFAGVVILETYRYTTMLRRKVKSLDEI